MKRLPFTRIKMASYWQDITWVYANTKPICHEISAMLEPTLSSSGYCNRKPQQRRGRIDFINSGRRQLVDRSTALLAQLPDTLVIVGKTRGVKTVFTYTTLLGHMSSCCLKCSGSSHPLAPLQSFNTYILRKRKL